MPPVILGPRCNRRVTCAASPSNDRSESAIAVNPTNPYNMIAAAKRFVNPMTYDFAIGVSYTFDAGLSWNEASLMLPAGASFSTDPAIAWDDLGNAYLVALPMRPPLPGEHCGFQPIDVCSIGISIYTSNTGGRTWSAPNTIHLSTRDDKQWAAGDTNPASPHHGNVYVVWDDGNQGKLCFARSLDHGASWVGVGAQLAGTPITGGLSIAEVNVASDGTVYIFGLGTHNGQNAIVLLKSTDGGQTFGGQPFVTTPAVVASPITQAPAQLPGGTFRAFLIPTGCCGSGNHILAAWEDYREGVARIYYARSNSSGNSWQSSDSGDPLLTGAVASALDQHDFHPQLIATPNGEIGCAFYEFGPKGGSATPLIDVVLAVSTDNGHTFPNRVTVTDAPWNPATDAPWAHGDPNVTFIGDYFGLDASRLGFFPLWTDTRTGVQELFVSRLAVNPTDVYIRDSSSDAGNVPSLGYHWEAPDLIIRRQTDGDTNFSTEELLLDGVTNHHVYGRVTNLGSNTARNVRLAVMLGNWPALGGLPGSEFRYPQDWYQDDQPPGMHQFLGESAAVDIPAGSGPQILGPIEWPAVPLPVPSDFHPCLLAEVRSDNDDSPGGSLICDIDADPDPCIYGSYFYNNNDVCQLNVKTTTTSAAKAASIEFPFLVGSIWSNSRFLEVVVEKERGLADVPMKLTMERVHGPEPRREVEHDGRESEEEQSLVDLVRMLEAQREAVLAGTAQPATATFTASEVVLLDGGRVVVRAETLEASEVIVPPGTVWRPRHPQGAQQHVHDVLHGAESADHGWTLTHHRASVGFPIAPGELRRMTLAFTVPENMEPEKPALVRIYQRNERHVITGGVFLKIERTAEPETEPKRQEHT
jgi:hypothetical protein